MIKILNKYKEMNVVLKAGFWFTVCSFLQKGVSLITVPIFTRIMSLDQYGTYSLYLSWLNIITVVTTLNLSYGVFNKAMISFENDRDRYISSMQGLTITLTGICFAIYCISTQQINKLFGLSTIMIVMMFAELFVTPSLSFWLGKKRFEYRYKKIVVISLIKAILNPFLGVILVLITPYKAEARVFATVVVEVIICGLITGLQFYKGKKFFVKDYWKYALSFNLPLIPHYLSGSILNQGDRIVIEKMVSSLAVAKYSVAYNVGMLAQLITLSLGQAFTPWLYKSFKEEKYEGINERINLLLVFVAGIVCVLMLFAPEVVLVFASKEYADSVSLIPPIAASVFFIFAYSIYSNIQFYFGKRLLIAIASFVAAALNILLNILLIPFFGYVAAAYTTLICYIAYTVIHFGFTQYILKINIKSSVIKMKGFAYVSLIVLINTLIINFVYQNAIIRYGIIFVIFSVCVVFNKRMAKMIRVIIKK